jgi:hypothetical protein
MGQSQNSHENKARFRRPVAPASEAVFISTAGGNKEK